MVACAGCCGGCRGAILRGKGEVVLAVTVLLELAIPLPLAYPLGRAGITNTAGAACDPFVGIRVEFVKLNKAAAAVSFAGKGVGVDTYECRENTKQARRKCEESENISSSTTKIAAEQRSEIDIHI